METVTTIRSPILPGCARRITAVAELSRERVTEYLEALGLDTLRAQRAAADRRIAWTDEAIGACLHDVDTSGDHGIRNPALALWKTYLQHGRLPPLPKPKTP